MQNGNETNKSVYPPYKNHEDIHHIEVTPAEWDRIYGGELTESDFSTSHPNLNRIPKIMSGINEYRRYKRRNEFGGDHYSFR